MSSILFLKEKRSADSLTTLISPTPPKSQLQPSVQQEVFTLHLADKNTLTVKSPVNSVFPLEDMSATYPEAQFDTLADFEKMWNQSEKDRAVVIISKVSTWDVRDIGGQKSVAIEQADVSFGTPVLNVNWQATPDGKEFLLTAHQSVGANNIKLTFRCLGERRSVNLQNYFGGIFDLANPKGSFEKVFPELAEQVSKAERTGKVKAIYDSLLVQEAAKAETLDAFGLHIPPHVATRFGIFVILAIQWYFFLHLAELDKAFDPNAPGWCVPWIGIYEKRTAKTTFIISVTLFPLLTMIVLITKGAPGNTWLLSLAAMSLMVGILTIRSMPVKASTEPAPRLE